jgi:hypothetical protein
VVRAGGRGTRGGAARGATAGGAVALALAGGTGALARTEGTGRLALASDVGATLGVTGTAVAAATDSAVRRGTTTATSAAL